MTRPQHLDLSSKLTHLAFHPRSLPTEKPQTSHVTPARDQTGHGEQLPLTEDSGQNVVQFWRGAHTGVIAAGVWLIATGAASSHLKLTERSGWVLAWSTILSNYFAVAALLVKVAVGATDSTRLGLHGLAHACYLA